MLYSQLISIADDERVFLLDEALQFRFGQLDGDATCAWKDLSGDEGDLWEFVSSKVSKSCRQELGGLSAESIRTFLAPPTLCLK